MQLSRNSSHKPGTKSDFYKFNILYDGIQDGFVISFRKKRNVFVFSVRNFLRLFEVIKMH